MAPRPAAGFKNARLYTKPACIYGMRPPRIEDFAELKKREDKPLGAAVRKDQGGGGSSREEKFEKVFELPCPVPFSMYQTLKGRPGFLR